MDEEPDYTEDLYEEDLEESYTEDLDTETYGESYGEPLDSDTDYKSSIKSRLVKYQGELGTAAGGAAGGAIMFGTPEAAAFTGLALGAAYLGGKITGKLGGKGLSEVRSYLDRSHKEDSENDKNYTV